MSDVIVDLAGQDLYRRSHGWIDFIVPETDESVNEAVLERVWHGNDDVGRPIDVDIAWCDDSNDADSDHPVTHWRLAGERTSKLAVRNLALTWPGVKSRLTDRLGTVTGRVALATDIRFFSNTEDELDRYPVVDLLSAELPIDGITYVLADGEIYRVDADFLAALDRDLQRLVIPSTLVPYRPGEPEDSYNRRAANATGMLLLDKTDVRPTGMTQIEALRPPGSRRHALPCQAPRRRHGHQPSGQPGSHRRHSPPAQARIARQARSPHRARQLGRRRQARSPGATQPHGRLERPAPRHLRDHRGMEDSVRQEPFTALPSRSPDRDTETHRPWVSPYRSC
jgi:hypothetical protein